MMAMLLLMIPQLLLLLLLLLLNAKLLRPPSEGLRPFPASPTQSLFITSLEFFIFPSRVTPVRPGAPRHSCLGCGGSVGRGWAGLGWAGQGLVCLGTTDVVAMGRIGERD